jgi:hypothetical protein
VQTLSSRRLFAEEDEFCIVENYKTLTPIAIIFEHKADIDNLDLFCKMFEGINPVCSKLFGERYFLRIDQSRGHFCILSLLL